MKLTIPVKTVSEANQREHWAARRRRKINQQNTATTYARMHRMHKLGDLSGVLNITLTRVSKTARKMDADNLAGSFKHVQDALAREIGIDDGKIRWSYSQRKGDVYAVEVEVAQA